jgi:nucleotide-binding universal stress UspA family protein
MHRPAILLAITGSEESRFAAEMCWDIAEKTNGKVLVQHVVDTETICELLRNDDGGIIGHSAYAETCKSVTQELHSLAAKLLSACVATGTKRQIETNLVIDHGNPIGEICRRACEHDLIIVGHRLPKLQLGHKRGCEYMKYAIAEGLVHNCPRPLLVVQQRHTEPATMKVVVTPDEANMGFVDACLKTASLLGMHPELLCIATDSRNEQARASFRKAIHELAGASVRVHIVGELVVEDTLSFLDATGGEEIDLDPSKTLLVMPTRGTGAARTTIIGVKPELLLHNSTPPNVLLWPEEQFPARKKIVAPDNLQASAGSPIV